MRETFKYILLFLVVVASRLPFLQNGFGLDGDSWSVALTADAIRATGEYEASRLPGNPVHEFLCSLIPRDGTYWKLNLLSAIFNALGVVFFALALRELKFRLPLFAATAFAAVPVVFISGTIAIDYSFGLAFLMGAFYAVCCDRSALAGLLLGLAVGSRITSGAMLLPYALMLLRSDGLHRNLWRIFNCLFIGLAIGALCYLPAFLRYGSGFLTYYDVSYPTIPRVLYRGFLEVWGPVGFAGLLIGILLLFLPSGMTRNNYLFPRSVSANFVIAWLVAMDLYIIAFIKLPMEAGYLIPAVPFIIMLLGKYLIRPAFTVFAGALIVSPFIVSISPAQRMDAEQPSAISFTAELGGERLIVDAMKGPVISYESRRQAGMRYAHEILQSLDTLKDSSVLVTGQWYNKMVFMQGDTMRGNVLLVPHVKQDLLLSYVREGRDIYYLPEQDEFNQQLKGADPKVFGGERYE